MEVNSIARVSPEGRIHRNFLAKTYAHMELLNQMDDTATEDETEEEDADKESSSDDDASEDGEE